jgi:hypothetical protein
LLRASTGSIPLASKSGWSCDWIASCIGYYGIPNFNCLLKPFKTIFNSSSFDQYVATKIKNHLGTKHS